MAIRSSSLSFLSSFMYFGSWPHPSECLKTGITVEVGPPGFHDQMSKVQARSILAEMVELPVFLNKACLFALPHPILVEQHNDAEICLKA